MNRAFISFDYDHDEDLKHLLVGQARHPGSPFEIADWSVKGHLPGYWQEAARQKIRRSDLTIVICGDNTTQLVAWQLKSISHVRNVAGTFSYGDEVDDSVRIPQTRSLRGFTTGPGTT